MDERQLRVKRREARRAQQRNEQSGVTTFETATPTEVLHVVNEHGTFDVEVGKEIACFPFYATFLKVVGFHSNVNPDVIVVVSSDNLYDTRLTRDIYAVR